MTHAERDRNTIEALKIALQQAAAIIEKDAQLIAADRGEDVSADQWLLTFQGWDTSSTFAQPSKRTVAKLIERGLVIPHERQVPAGVGALTMTVIEYEVPLVVHLAWCLMCSRPRARRRLTPPGR